MLFEQTHGIAQRRHAFPTQFHVVIQAATDQMQMAVVQARYHAATIQIDDFGVGLRQLHHVFIAACTQHFAIGDGDGLYLGLFFV